MMTSGADHPAGTRQLERHCFAESGYGDAAVEALRQPGREVREVSHRESRAGQVQPYVPECEARAALVAPRDAQHDGSPSSPLFLELAETLCVWAAVTAFGAVSPQILLF
jgi:hypothetical protein